MSAVEFHRQHLIRRRRNTRMYYAYLTNRAAFTIMSATCVGMIVWVSYLMEPCR